ncbi:MAG: magnesium transporter CorA family protein [Thermoleophilia bacterium]
MERGDVNEDLESPPPGPDDGQPPPGPEDEAQPARAATETLSSRPRPALLAVGPSGTEPVYPAGVGPTLRALRRPGAPIAWLHADSGEDLLAALEDFGLHELAVRSLRDGPERPRVEEYPDHLYVSLVRASPAAAAGEEGAPTEEDTKAAVEGLRIFVGERWVVSYGRLAPEEHAALTEVVVRQVMERGRGPSFVLYYLAEWVVETFYPLLDSLDTRVDSLEDLVLVDTEEGTRQELFRLKRDLVELRRKVAPTRDVMQRLSGHGLAFMEPAVDVFFRDVHDDVLLVLEQLDTYRDILSSALELHLSTVSNRLNEVMKRLTLVATLFMPITFITGVFGMNFAGLPVGSAVWLWGTLVAMVAISAGMAGYAWKRGWF